MLRYLILAWSPCDDGAAVEATELIRRCQRHTPLRRAAIEIDGLAVLYAPEDVDASVQKFPVGCGAILGPLYTRPSLHPDDPIPTQTTLTAYDAQRIVLSLGRDLVTHWWGDYVAVFRTWSSSAIHVLRGPGGMLPCSYLRLGRIHAYFSDIECITAISDVDFSVSWRSIARAFIGPQWSGDSQLNEVREVIPGQCEQIRADCVRPECLWSLEEVSREPLAMDFETAARALRTVTRACTLAMASRFSGALVSLSGGLDSSITLACLAGSTAPLRITSLTQFVEGGGSDERHFARIAARHAGCELIEYSRDEVPLLSSASYSRRLEISPGLRFPGIDRIEPEIASSRSAQAVFYGHGGDEVFVRNAHVAAASHFIQQRGLRRQLLGLLLDAAFVEGVTVWEVLGRAFGWALAPRRFNVIAELTRDIERSTLLHADVLAELARNPRSFAPMLRFRNDTPAVRRWQIALLTARRTLRSPFDRTGDAVRMCPLLAQPLMELSVRIPSWYEMAGRRDRALARHAFRHDLAPQIVDRRDKGVAESVAASILARNLPAMRELLLDGLVAGSGIIDRARLEIALSGAPSALDVTSVPLFDIAGTELFARTWHSHSTNRRQNNRRNDRPYDESSSWP